MNLRQTHLGPMGPFPYLESELLGLLVLLGGHVRVRHLELQTEGRVHTVDTSVAVHLEGRGHKKKKDTKKGGHRESDGRGREGGGKEAHGQTRKESRVKEQDLRSRARSLIHQAYIDRISETPCTC
jgi:hypothetical protein